MGLEHLAVHLVLQPLPKLAVSFRNLLGASVANGQMDLFGVRADVDHPIATKATGLLVGRSIELEVSLGQQGSRRSVVVASSTEGRQKLVGVCTSPERAGDPEKLCH